MARREEYDWLEDPFDEKKCAEEMERARSGKGAGCGFLAVLVAVVVFVVVFGMAFLGVFAQGL